ncbi:hypothetical protein RHGRI_009986 [Rhododendron griersonianum]|uniref:AAA+ ATPase domain-containing protein n=1 Tax=Rhododendron griersonianum TaxID=479676 RepID=A0AAV6KHH3_9ERIC|nr:hypothetical protein RHGRI_009986 [Rhododendron griersonianum]
MFGLEIILGIIFEKIIEPVIQPVGRHAGFLFHYKRNLNSLEDEVNNLQEHRSDVKGKVNEAIRSGEAIDNKVSVWQDDADKTRQEVEEFRNEKTVKENMPLCFSFSCPNFISRYRLSKEAERKVVRVKHLTEKGGNIGTVSHPREDPPEVVFRSRGNYECFHSRDKVFNDIVKVLKDPEVNMIGVYGTGGVGKTTMVTKVAEQVKEDGTFDEVVIAVVSQDVNVIKIQGQLAARLKPPLSVETDDEVRRASRLWNRLNNGMKNLIILDDVWHELDLKEIGIPITDENKSCKVVLTSRNRDVWKNMDVKDFRIEILSERESWALFQKKVGNYVDAHELREIAWEVCKECQGLPVAINAIGAALKGKYMYAWRDALDKLKNSMLKDIVGIDQKVYASLKWSYDQLDSEDARSCFLLCCLFPEDAEIRIDDLVRYYMTRRTFHRDQKPDSLEKALDRVRTVVSTLISCCLLLDGENYYKVVVKMHDVVRDVAISIAKAEKYSFLVRHGVKDWPEKATNEQCSVISLRPRDMREFPDELVCPALHTLRLDFTDDKSRLQVPDRFFSGTENLMVLDLNGVSMSPILPASLAKLAKLQMLCLDGCKLGDIAILKDLKDHLEILSLRDSDIEVLPPEVGELTLLRVLDMDDCYKLQVIPKGVISKLFRLEELYMPRNFRQWERTGPGTGRDISCVSLDELMSLTRLTTLLHVLIPDPALLPKDFTFENLVRFDIAVGEDASDEIYNKDSTGVLQLEKIHVANGLESLLGKPKPKWSIQRNGLYPSTSFYHLTYLSITDCRLKYLFSPSSARGLVQLKKLFIRGCMDMEGVIGNEGEEDHEDIIPISFSRLNGLHLKDLPNLKSFYPKKEKKATSSESCSAHDAKTVLFTDKVAFPKLEDLQLGTLGGIALRQLLGACEPSIKTLVFSECDELSTVVSPRLFGRLRNVDLLSVKSCIGVTEVFHFDGLEVGESQECVGSLIQVRMIELETLPKLTCLWNKDPHSNLRLQNLEYLTIKKCHLLRNLLTASVAKALGGLKVLYLRSCSTMEEVVFATDEGHEEVIDDQEIVFPKLEWLILKDLSNLKSFCSADYNFNLPSLQRVVVKRCPNMQTFTSGSVHMPPTNFITRGFNDGPVIEDLNKHLQQRHSKGDQETVEENEMGGAEDWFSDLFLV